MGHKSKFLNSDTQNSLREQKRYYGAGPECQCSEVGNGFSEQAG